MYGQPPLRTAYQYLVLKRVPANNNKTYRECLQTGLIPFLEGHHLNGVETVFWPNLRTVHYALGTCDFFKDKNINFVKKHRNPGSLPKCRPLADYMTILKYLVYEGKWTAESLEQLEERIREKAAILNSTEVVAEIAARMKELPEKLKQMEYNGLPGTQRHFVNEM